MFYVSFRFLRLLALPCRPELRHGGNETSLKLISLFMNILKNFMTALLALTIIPMNMTAQSDERMRAILYLSGADSEEELDEQEVERFAVLASRPLEINLASKSHLLSSGLMSQYQVASLMDYRSRNGDVLSASELAAVDGFGELYVKALIPFISFASNALPGQTESGAKRLAHELLARSAVKGEAFNYGCKYRMDYGETFGFSSAARTKYSDREQFPPSAWSMNMTFYGRRRLGKIIIGDFNARFGQGLALWSGMSLSGLSSSSSFSKRPSGLSPSCSWSGIGSHRGVAADFTAGRMAFSTFASFPGLRSWCESGKPAEISLMTGTNVTRYSRHGQFSFTGYCLTGLMNMPVKLMNGKLSGDLRYSWRGVDYFGELAWDFTGKGPGSILGAVFSLGGEWKLSSVVHSYSSDFSSDYTGGIRSWTKTSDEHGVALGLERGLAFLTADLAVKDMDRTKRQIRVLFKLPLQLTGTTVLSLRVTERFRPYEEILRYRTGARCDLDWSSSGLSARYGPSDKPAWKVRGRIEGLLCRSLAGLAYLEGGRKADRFSAYLRGTIFIVDNWDDRIYSYERDAPGNFTVPAYYGRGWSLSAVAGGKLVLDKRTYKTLKLYFRASTVGYSFMKDPKPPVTEVKLQAVLTL